MKTLHITGFADFLAPKSTGMLPNTSRLLVEAVEQQWESLQGLGVSAGADRVETRVFPMPQETEVAAMQIAFSRHLQVFLASLNLETDAWLAFGQGAIEQKAPRLEPEFTNALTMGGHTVPIVPGEALTKKTGPGREDTQTLVKRVRAQGEPLEEGVDAGTFLCNWVGAEGYALLGDRARFVHLQALSNRDMTAPLWAANKDIPSFRKKVPAFEDLTAADVWANYKTADALLQAWRPFELK